MQKITTCGYNAPFGKHATATRHAAVTTNSSKYRIYLYFMKKSFLLGILAAVLALGVADAPAQNYPAPYEEKLLNGLKVLVWSDPAADQVTLKLRIHAGSAFDPKDNTGVMALLSDIIFPDQQAYEFFKEDLEGSLAVSSNYDYIQITATGKAGDETFLSM